MQPLRVSGLARFSRLVALTLGLAVPAFAASGEASSDPLKKELARAEALYQDLEYEQALALVHRAVARAKSPADELLVRLWEGVIASDLGKQNVADAAFRRALELDRNAKLPTRVSPKVEKDFEAHRAALPPADVPRRVELVPETKPPVAAVTTAKPGAFSLERHWLPLSLGGVALAATAGATVFGLQSAQHAQIARNASYQGEAAAALRQSEQGALVANVLWATAGSALVGGVISYVLGMPPAAPTPKVQQVQR